MSDQENAKRSQGKPLEVVRNPYEQQEYQRTHAKLFTTVKQSVNIDGSLITYEEVTRNIQKQLDRLEELHNNHPYWFTVAPKEQQDIYFFLNNKLDQVRRTFVDNYKRVYRKELEQPNER